jgi:ABC-type hemin transport system ATPase subunit
MRSSSSASASGWTTSQLNSRAVNNSASRLHEPSPKRPLVLLCDEPTGALDFRTGILVLEVLERVNRELGAATAVITHNAPIAEIADRVVSLADGRVQSERHEGRRQRAADLRW